MGVMWIENEDDRGPGRIRLDRSSGRA